MGLIDSIIGAESGGNANARNPNSSASGAGQFIDSAWLSTLRQHRPDIADGKTDADLLALKSNPDLSREMTGAYAADNGATLSKAGLPVTPGTTYLAHFAGPQGAVKVLQSDPNAPVSAILGAAAVKANPFLQGMTASGLQAWADKKMGASSPTSQPVQMAAATPAQAPAQTPPQTPTQAIPQQPAPIFAAPPAPQISQPGQPAPQQINMPQVATPSFFGQMQAEQGQPPPIFAPPRRPIDLSKLKAALGNRGFFYGTT